MNNNIKETTSLVFVKGNNLYDENTMLELVGAYRAGNSGNIITSATNKGLKLQAEPNSVYTITQTGASNYHEIAFFDKSFRYLSGTSITSTQITTPANCYIMTIQTNINATNIMINKGSTALPYEPYVEKQIHIKNKNGVFEKFYGEREVNQENYSLGEQKIGTWIDGKPLYRKIFNFGALPNNSSKMLNINISNFGQMISLTGVTYNSSAGFTLFLPYIHSSSSDVINMWFQQSNMQLGVQTHSDRTGYTECYIIIEYTKTTD